MLRRRMFTPIGLLFDGRDPRCRIDAEMTKVHAYIQRIATRNDSIDRSVPHLGFPLRDHGRSAGGFNETDQKER